LFVLYRLNKYVIPKTRLRYFDIIADFISSLATQILNVSLDLAHLFYKLSGKYVAVRIMYTSSINT